MKKLLFCSIFLIVCAVPTTRAQNAEIVDYDRTIKKYFVVELTPKEAKLNPADRMKIQQEHMKNIKNLVLENKLVMAGPFEGGGGLFFLSVATKEEAETIIKEDPTVKNGLNTYQIRTWYTERGLFTLENKGKE
ncbi:MAG: YciI family protein [Weeksellaceae bacterium]